MKLRVGARGSALAQWQTRHIVDRLQVAWPEIEIDLVEVNSAGDRIQDLPLSHV